ncbi:DEAD/DEAH box helicase family protein [bacterium]|nr:DEAD/DEAH box helicase family protein [bacterium]RQV98550.1 MAG: DEAD/DEAH box helicase [bacterium]
MSAYILRFHEGTLILENWKSKTSPPYFQWDPRNRSWRTLAINYTKVIRTFSKMEISLIDKASKFDSLDLQLAYSFDLYPYQREALQMWKKENSQGTVVLPTGSGKTLVAIHAMALLKISTLIISPTIDLTNQWYDRITDSFNIHVGILGGGYHEIHPVTVTTYDSAYRHIDLYGDRFGFLVFDEVHHLPAPSYIQIPELSLAPYRLGLTATYRRSDAQHVQLNHLIGPVIYEKRIKELKGEHLSDYEIHRVSVPLTQSEREMYDTYSSSYHGYVKEKHVRFYGNRWEQFIRASGYDSHARKALLARKEMRQIVFGAEQKLKTLESLLKQHCTDRVIIFTLDNHLVYTISIKYLIPAITHHTDTVERKAILDRFRQGEYRFIVTSKVLNEGVDVPEANVAIILGGSANPTEYLQRLGRILRKKSGKKAFLYEIVMEGTQETSVSYRRRKSDAYR